MSHKNKPHSPLDEKNELTFDHYRHLSPPMNVVIIIVIMCEKQRKLKNQKALKEKLLHNWKPIFVSRRDLESFYCLVLPPLIATTTPPIKNIIMKNSVLNA